MKLVLSTMFMMIHHKLQVGSVNMFSLLFCTRLKLRLVQQVAMSVTSKQCSESKEL